MENDSVPGEDLEVLNREAPAVRAARLHFEADCAGILAGAQCPPEEVERLRREMLEICRFFVRRHLRDCGYAVSDP